MQAFSPDHFSPNSLLLSQVYASLGFPFSPIYLIEKEKPLSSDSSFNSLILFKAYLFLFSFSDRKKSSEPSISPKTIPSSHMANRDKSTASTSFPFVHTIRYISGATSSYSS